MNIYYDKIKSQTGLVSIGIFVRVGSFCEKDDEKGYSHFLEHLLFAGTKKYPTSTLLAEKLSELGCEYNAHTSYDYTAYHITCQKDVLDDVLHLFKLMINDSVFNSKEFDREKKVVCQENNLSRNKTVLYNAHKKIISMMYGTDTKVKKQFNILGTKKSIQTASRDKIIRYWKKWYTSDKMLVIVSGETGNGIKKISGLKFPSNLQPKRVSIGPKNVTIKKKGLGSGYIYTGFYTYDFENDVKKTLILELILKYLCTTFSSVLHKVLRIQNGLSYSVKCIGSNSFFNYMTSGFGYKGFVISINDEKIHLGLEKINEVLKNVCRDGIDEKTLVVCKRLFLTGYKNIMQTTLNRIFYFGTMSMKFPGLNLQPENIIQMSKNITLIDFNSMLCTLLDPSRSYTVIIKNKK
jgi:predicted Zn-dependent peptidase